MTPRHLQTPELPFASLAHTPHGSRPGSASLRVTPVYIIIMYMYKHVCVYENSTTMSNYDV